MGTSGKRYSVEAALVMVVVLLGTCASGAHAALGVLNDLKHTLTVLHPPGCCSSCVPAPGKYCPAVCEECANVVVEKGKLVTLNARVGPYPVAYLKIQVKDIVYCVAQKDLKLLTATVTLVVGRNECGPNKSGIEGFVVEGNTVVSICLLPCIVYT